MNICDVEEFAMTPKQRRLERTGNVVSMSI